MKKVLAFILSVVVIFSMVACSAQNQTNDDTVQTNSTSSSGSNETDKSTDSSSGSNETDKSTDGIKKVYLISVMAGRLRKRI